MNGRHIDDCYLLNRWIERLIQEGDLKSMSGEALDKKETGPELKGEINLEASFPYKTRVWKRIVRIQRNFF